MHGASRDASVFRRMPMRARSRNEQVARRGPERVCQPSVVRLMLWALWPTAVERESHGATPTNRSG